MVLSGLIDAAVSRRPKLPSSLFYPLRLFHLSLISRLGLLETCGSFGECPIFLLVLFRLLVRALGVLPCHFCFADRAFLFELRGGATVYLGLIPGPVLDLAGRAGEFIK